MKSMHCVIIESVVLNIPYLFISCVYNIWVQIKAWLTWDGHNISSAFFANSRNDEFSIGALISSRLIASAAQGQAVLRARMMRTGTQWVVKAQDAERTEIQTHLEIMVRMHWWDRVPIGWVFRIWNREIPIPSLLFLYPHSFPFLPLPLQLLLSLPLPFRSRPLKTTRGVWRSAESSPSGRNRIWCIFASKSDIWWQLFLTIFTEKQLTKFRNLGN